MIKGKTQINTNTSINTCVFGWCNACQKQTKNNNKGGFFGRQQGHITLAALASSITVL
jgi:hypothetical protein